MVNGLDYTLYYIVQLTSTAHSPEDNCRNILGHSYADAPALHYHNAIPYYICMGIGINIKSYADIVKGIKQKKRREDQRDLENFFQNFHCFGNPIPIFPSRW